MKVRMWIAKLREGEKGKIDTVISGNVFVIWDLVLACFHQQVIANTFVSAVKYDLWSHVAS